MSTPQEQLDLSDIAEPVASAPRPARPRAATPSAPAHPAGAYDSLTEGDWSLERDATRVKDWFHQTYGADLPVTAYGESATHRRRGLDHSNSMDVGLNPASERGQAFVSYLKDNNIPFLAYDRAVPGAATGPHVHVGFESRSLGALPRLNLEDIAEPALDLSDLAEDAPAEEAGDLVKTDAKQEAEPQSTLTPLPQRQTFDPTTEEGRAMRDERAAVERTPGATLEVAVPLPANLEGAEGGPLVREAYKSAALARGVPAEFFDRWAAEHAPSGYGLHGPDGRELTVPDAMKPGAYDEKNRTLRVKLDPTHLSKIVDDYNASKGVASRAYDWATDSERSAGEKALDMIGAGASAVKKGYDAAAATPQGQIARAGYEAIGKPAMKAVGALDTALWAKTLGYGDQTAQALAELHYQGIETPVSNPVGEIAGKVLEPVNPRAASAARAILGVVAQPTNLIPLPEVGALLKAGKLGRAVEAGGELTTRVARALGVMDRGLVEHSPLGIEKAAEDSADVFLRGQNGRNFLFNTGTHDLVDLETGELLDINHPDTAKLFDSQPEPPHHSTSQPRTSEGMFDGPPLDLTDIAEGPEQPLHEFLSDITGRPAPEIQPKAAPAPAGGIVGRAAQTASDIINLPKSLKSAFALHGPFRQGVFQAAAHPTFLQDAVAEQVKAFASESAYRDFTQSLVERPWFKPMQDAGLFLPSTYDAEFGGHAPAMLREERFASAAAEKIPGVRRSSRAYNAAMDSIRSQAVETYLTDLYGPEMDLSKADPRTLKALAELVNVTTGRGVFPLLDRAAWGRKVVAALNNPFWSPRAMTSRFNVLSPYRLISNAANPATRPVAWLQVRDSMRALTTAGATLGLLSLVPGVTVGLNPFKPNWGKVSIGDTHFDMLDGIPATARYAAQMSRSFYLKAEGKAVKPREAPATLTKDFLRQRLSPSGQVAADAYTGKTVEGAPFTYSGAVRDLLVPFVVEDMYKGWLDAGGSSVGGVLSGEKEFRTGFRGAAKGLPSAFGIPSSTYRERGRASEAFDLSDIVEH